MSSILFNSPEFMVTMPSNGAISVSVTEAANGPDGVRDQYMSTLPLVPSLVMLSGTWIVK